MFLRKRPSAGEIRNFLASQAHSRLSYGSKGFTDGPSVPVNYTVDRARILLGHGEQVWQRATRAIDEWQMFNFGWIRLCWPAVKIEEGETVAVLVRHFGFWSLNAARIVYTIKEPDTAIR